MEKTKIKIPKGHKIANVDKETGDVTFEKLPDNVRTRINGWPEIFKHHKMTEKSFDEWCKDIRPHEKGTRKRELVTAAYNGRQLDDPLPKFGPNTHRKYYPWCKMPNEEGARFAFSGNVCDISHSGVGARLVFDGEDAYENMIDAFKKFPEAFEESMTL